ncbi:MAG: hypothetical protein HKN29_15000 [Rhodothermales bacterium]|nr:hypothetical protein [Rhodothermales bacterium]
MRLFRTLALPLLIATALVGCDFDAAKDAFEEFDLIIELEPINTVVNGIVVNNATGNLVSAELTFSGPGASMLIDAYSDPITDLDAESGVVTFGIQNAVVPSEGNPVGLTVTARADGYYTTSETFELTETGDAQFTIGMTSSDVNASIMGTSTGRSTNTTTDSGGAVTQATTVTTQPTSQTSAAATVAVPQGAVPVTATGSPLTGQLTIELRSFDSGAGLAALPTAARQRSDGTNQAVGGAAFFKMTDANGNVAVGAVAASSGGAASKSSGVCTGGVQITLTSSDQILRTAYDGEVAAGRTVDARIYAFTPADGQNNEVASTLVETDGTGLKVDLCLGGTGDGVINTGAIGNAADGIIYSYAFGSNLTTSGTLGNQVQISGLTGAQNLRFRLTGPGMNKTATSTRSNGTFSLGALVGASGSFDIVNAGLYTLSASYVGSNEVTSLDIASPLSGSSTLVLPSTTDLATYNFTASLQCDDPDNQEFEVQIGRESLDAVSAFYRIANAGDGWSVLGHSAITKKDAGPSKIEIQGTLSLKPSTLYDFRGVLGTDASETQETTPAAAPGSTTDWVVALSTDDVGISCK